MIHDPHQQAVTNLETALAVDRRFPENAFRGTWDAFFFFDPDALFERQFIEVAKTLLACENGACVCMRNLDVASAAGSAEQASIFVDNETTGAAYLEQLRGPGPGPGWLYRMDRYGCTSDRGNWCIYCERNNEIASIAVRWNGSLSRFARPLQQLDALPIEQAIEKPSSYGLSPRGLPEKWRKKILQEYASRPDPGH
jgi:hypothetical protein